MSMWSHIHFLALYSVEECEWRVAHEWTFIHSHSLFSVLFFSLLGHSLVLIGPDWKRKREKYRNCARSAPKVSILAHVLSLCIFIFGARIEWLWVSSCLSFLSFSLAQLIHSCTWAGLEKDEKKEKCGSRSEWTSFTPHFLFFFSYFLWIPTLTQRNYSGFNRKWKEEKIRELGPENDFVIKDLFSGEPISDS